MVKNSPASAGDTGDVGLIPWSGRASGGENGNPSSILAWKIPWTEEPGELYSPWDLKESDTTEQVVVIVEVTLLW